MLYEKEDKHYKETKKGASLLILSTRVYMLFLFKNIFGFFFS